MTKAATAILALACLATAQDKQPSRATCDAENNIIIQQNKDALSGDDLTRITRNLTLCSKSSNENLHLMYLAGAGVAGMTLAQRYMHFIHRHNMFAEFLKEDEQGLR